MVNGIYAERVPLKGSEEVEVEMEMGLKLRLRNDYPSQKIHFFTSSN